MKTIGLIGGMSWESTAHYYRIINEKVKQQLGGFSSAKVLLYSVDFDEYEKYQQSGEWEEAGRQLGAIASRLEGAGADFIILCTNTMHKVSSAIKAAISVPFIHIAQATVDCILKENIPKVGLLGTKYTMEESFYKDVILNAGVDVVIPSQKGIHRVNEIIYDELCQGIIKTDSKDEYITIIDELINNGAEAIILGCTEIGMLINQEDVDVPVFDTTMIHAECAAYLAMDD